MSPEVVVMSPEVVVIRDRLPLLIVKLESPTPSRLIIASESNVISPKAFNASNAVLSTPCDPIVIVLLPSVPIFTALSSSPVAISTAPVLEITRASFVPSQTLKFPSVVFIVVWSRSVVPSISIDVDTVIVGASILAINVLIACVAPAVFTEVVGRDWFPWNSKNLSDSDASHTNPAYLSTPSLYLPYHPISTILPALLLANSYKGSSTVTVVEFTIVFVPLNSTFPSTVKSPTNLVWPAATYNAYGFVIVILPVDWGALSI